MKTFLNLASDTDLKKRDLPAMAKHQKLFSLLARHLSKTSEWKAACLALGLKNSVRSYGSLEITIGGDKFMKDLQWRFRGLRKTTDVLSFPAIENPELRVSYAELKASERSLGSIAISWPAIERGAKRGRRKANEEYLEILIHGFLHLLGFDHVLAHEGVTLARADRMRKLQKELLNKPEIRRFLR